MRLIPLLLTSVVVLSILPIMYAVQPSQTVTITQVVGATSYATSCGVGITCVIQGNGATIVATITYPSHEQPAITNTSLVPLLVLVAAVAFGLGYTLRRDVETRKTKMKSPSGRAVAACRLFASTKESMTREHCST